MTTTETRPAPRTSPCTSPDAGTSARDLGHEHSWTTDSRHPTSVGWVLYVHCTGCGAHRVDLQARTDAPPAALSRAVGGSTTAPTGPPPAGRR
jgi:hypothetical protein